MVIKTGLSSFQSYISQGYTSNYLPPTTNNIQVGKVFGVVLNEVTPSKEAFEKVGRYAGLGAIFYIDYNTSKTLTPDNVNLLNDCSIALPFDPNIKNYPLIGELVTLIDSPSPASQYFSSIGGKYYTGIINTWNNPQQNAPITILGDDNNFFEGTDIRPLLPFEGDFIIQSRRGSGIRFGTTNKNRSILNEWSSIGEDGDPITIMVNGYVTTDSSSLSPNIEEINKEQSSIYLTSTQKIPLTPGASIVNSRVNTIAPKDYVSSQLIFNSDRITLNSKKDEVLLFAKTNIELNTDNIININAGRVAHINSPFIALGTDKDGSYPTEPVLLGNQMSYTFDILISALSNLASSLTQASTQDGPIVACNDAGAQLFAVLKRLCDQVEKCLSTKVYTT